MFRFTRVVVWKDHASVASWVKNGLLDPDLGYFWGKFSTAPRRKIGRYVIFNAVSHGMFFEHATA
jgi:hypothetical protein